MTRGLRPGDFTYDLPPDLIAQDPLPDRAASRLLVLERGTGAIRNAVFRSLPELVAPADVVVLNASRVIPARLRGMRETTPGREARPAELLLVRALSDGSWLAMVHPGGKLKPGRRIRIGADVTVEILDARGGGLRRVGFVGPLDATAAMAKYGAVPLPPTSAEPLDRATASATRRFTPPTTAVSPRRPPGSTSRRTCWRTSSAAARPSCRSTSTSARARSNRSRVMTSQPTSCTRRRTT